jgi:hypothetical protein
MGLTESGKAVPADPRSNDRGALNQLVSGAASFLMAVQGRRISEEGSGYTITALRAGLKLYFGVDDDKLTALIDKLNKAAAG